MSLTTLKPKIATLDTRNGSPAAVKRIRGTTLQNIRDRILARDEYTCQVCGHVSARLVVDHIVPLHLGGGNNDDNLQCLCRRCHDLKSAKEEAARGF